MIYAGTICLSKERWHPHIQSTLFPSRLTQSGLYESEKVGFTVAKNKESCSCSVQILSSPPTLQQGEEKKDLLSTTQLK